MTFRQLIVHKLFGASVKLFIATRNNILSVIDQYRGNSSEITKVITEEGEADDKDKKPDED